MSMSILQDLKARDESKTQWSDDKAMVTTTNIFLQCVLLFFGIKVLLHVQEKMR